MRAKLHYIILSAVFLLLFLSFDLFAGDNTAVFVFQPLQTGGGSAILPVRDPFYWTAEQQEIIAQNTTPSHLAFSHLMLQAIFWDKESPQVVINQTILFEGDKLGEFEVIHIDQTEVTVALHNYQHVLQFEDVEIKFND